MTSIVCILNLRPDATTFFGNSSLSGHDDHHCVRSRSHAAEQFPEAALRSVPELWGIKDAKGIAPIHRLGAISADLGGR